MRTLIALCLLLSACTPKPAVTGDATATDPLEEYYCLAPKLRVLAKSSYTAGMIVEAKPAYAAKYGDGLLWYIRSTNPARAGCAAFGATLPAAVEMALQKCTPEYEAAQRVAAATEDESWKSNIPKYEAVLAKQREMCLTQKPEAAK